MLRLLAASAFAPLGAFALPPVQSIDIYGSSVFDSATVRAEFGADILRYVELLAPPNPETATPDKAPEREAAVRAIATKIGTSLELRAPLAYFEISPTTGPSRQVNVTVDVVEKVDEARRIPFRDAPTAELGDPGGLFALWAEYLRAFFELARAGAPLSIDPNNCPVLHCLAPFDLPELAPYLKRLNDGAREHENELYAVAENSRRRFRASDGDVRACSYQRRRASRARARPRDLRSEPRGPK